MKRRRCPGNLRPERGPHPQGRIAMAILLAHDAVESERYRDHRTAANCRNEVRYLLHTVCRHATGEGREAA